MPIFSRPDKDKSFAQNHQSPSNQRTNKKQALEILQGLLNFPPSGSSVPPQLIPSATSGFVFDYAVASPPSQVGMARRPHQPSSKLKNLPDVEVGGPAERLVLENGDTKLCAQPAALVAVGGFYSLVVDDSTDAPANAFSSREKFWVILLRPVIPRYYPLVGQDVAYSKRVIEVHRGFGEGVLKVDTADADDVLKRFLT